MNDYLILLYTKISVDIPKSPQMQNLNKYRSNYTNMVYDVFEAILCILRSVHTLHVI